MPGRQEQNKEPWDKSFDQRIPPTNGTGKQRAIPHRPSTMTRLDTAPSMPRVARPQRRPAPEGNIRRRLVIWSTVFVVCALLAAFAGYGLYSLISASSANAGGAIAVTGFLQDVSDGNYDQAYNDLHPAFVISAFPTANDFKQMAQNDDRCYGKITNYQEVDQSATTSPDNKTQSYVYNITRSKLSQKYQMRLTVQQDDSGNWKVSSFGSTNELGPEQPPCS